MKQAELFQNYRDFTADSLGWCIKEAEQGTLRVTGAIDSLLKDLSRVSLMSADSLKALQSLQGMLQGFDQTNYDQLQKSLATLSKENAEMDAYIQPIRESLQFQDRFRQNLENVVKMIDVWQAERAAVLAGGGGALPAEQMLAFGQALAKVTTMKRERDIIRKHIAGMDPELEAARVQLF